MSPAVLRVVDALRCAGCEPHEENGEWRARCPVHGGESKRSLKIDEGRDGRALVYCFNECPFGEIVESAGLDPNDLFVDAPKAERRIVATYIYTDEKGTPLFRKLRYDPKSFSQERYEGGQWIGGPGCMKSVRRVLYELPRTIAGVQRDATIYVVAGEKDADAINALDPDQERQFTATTNSEGEEKAKGDRIKWLPEYTAALRGVRVRIVQDKDDAGRYFAPRLRDELIGAVAHVEIVEAKSGKDAYDHLAAGHSLAELVPFTEQGDLADAPINPAVSLATVTPLHVEYVVRDLFRLVGVALIYGAASVYKTLLMLRLVTEVMQARGHASGAPKLYGHPDATILRPWRRVVWVSAEETAGALRARWDLVLAALGIKAEDVSGEILFVWPFSKDGVLALDRAEELLDSVGGDVDAMIFDSWTSLVPAMFEGRGVEWDRDNIATRHLINILRDVAERRKVAIHVVHHEGKDAGRGLRGPSELRNSADTVIRLERLPERRVKVKVEKQRDGRDEWDFTLAVNFTADAFHVRPEERKRPTLTQPQQTVLAFLTGRGSASVAEIVKGTELTRSSVKRALEGLAKDGTVVSTEDTDGNGSIVWSVSEGVREVSGNA